MNRQRFASNRTQARPALLAIVAVSGIWATAAHAFEISEAQRTACTPDVLRLCSAALPDAGRIVACMRTNKAQVSAGCRAVIPASAWASTKTKVAAR